MSSIEILKPFLDGGIQSTNFFNGRLLTAEDLSLDRAVNRLQQQQLGQAIGDGVVSGLQVKLAATSQTSNPTITVSAGLALNRKGQTLSLSSDVDVVLVSQQGPTASAADAGMFQVCSAPAATPAFTGYGAYILALSSASGFAGQAPVNGIPPGNTTMAQCGSKYIVEGVKFGLVQLDINTLPNISDATRATLKQLMNQGDPASLSLLRNLLAHLCFGTEERAGFVSDPFGLANGVSPYATSGALDTLRSLGRLTDCDVPLALLYWTTSGVRFVDMGSVRRRPVSGPPSQYWPFVPAGGYPSIGEVVSVQFQEHLASLLQPGRLPTALRAIDYFRYFPAVGAIPFANTSSASGFDYLQFFQGVTYRDPVYIEGAKFEHLIRDSLSYRPVDLSSHEMLWLYLVRENMQTIAENTFNPPQAYILFASGHIPYLGDARFDLGHWEYSNFSSLADH